MRKHKSLGLSLSGFFDGFYEVLFMSLVSKQRT